MQMIAGFVDAYLRLSAPEQKVFGQELAAYPGEKETIMKLTTSWEEEGIAKGLTRGVQQGKADLILRQLRRRCREVPTDLEQQVRSLDADALDVMGDALFDFTSPADVRAWLATRTV